MIARVLWTLAALGFAVGAFCGAGPTTVVPNPFGILFLFVAAFIWFGWSRIKGAFSGGPGTIDAIASNYVERDSSGGASPSRRS